MPDIPVSSIVHLEFTDEISYIRDEYLKAKILSQKSKSDAEHVASATIANADFIVSWNFKHIVNFDKINGFNSVNLKNGYKIISIYSPKEVIYYE